MCIKSILAIDSSSYRAQDALANQRGSQIRSSGHQLKYYPVKYSGHLTVHGGLVQSSSKMTAAGYVKTNPNRPFHSPLQDCQP